MSALPSAVEDGQEASRVRALKFRKKPVEIEAIRVRDALYAAAHVWTDLPDWLRQHYEIGNVVFAATFVQIRTLEGVMTGNFDDWIIRGVEGEAYPCKPNIFEATYEPIENSPQRAATPGPRETMDHSGSNI